MNACGQETPIFEWILLKNGNMISGRPQLGYDRTTIELPNGSRMVMSTDDISFICDSYSEAFQFQKRAITADDIDGQVALFRWCLRNKQFELAHQQIDDLQFTKMPPGDLLMLLRQLDSAVASMDTQNRDPKIEVAADFQMLQPQLSNENLLGADPNIRTVGFETDLPAKKTTTLNVNDLERVLENIPDFGKQSFKRVVEPIIVKNCSNAGCHHQNQQVMPLMTMSRGESIPKRMSQQNLVQVMRFVEQETMEGENLLLKQALSVHANCEKAPIDEGSREFILLTEWVALMDQPTKDAHLERFFPDTKDSQIDDKPQPIQTIPKLDSFLRGTEPKTKINETSDIKNAKIESQGMLQPSHKSSEAPKIPRLDPSTISPQSNNPFDPSAFNRRHHGGVRK